MNAELKYIRHSKVGFVLIARQDDVYHSHLAQAVLDNAGGVIVSAGFASIFGGRVRCWGKSESLSIASKPDDAEQLARQLGLTAPAHRKGQAA